jgi:mRNA interferase HigB
MRVISRRALTQFWAKHTDAEQPLRTWLARVRHAEWANSAELKSTFPKADIINSERVVFDICGGNYRLTVAVKYSAKIVWVKFIGTHAAYDKVDATTVSDF